MRGQDVGLFRLPEANAGGTVPARLNLDPLAAADPDDAQAGRGSGTSLDTHYRSHAGRLLTYPSVAPALKMPTILCRRLSSALRSQAPSAMFCRSRPNAT